MIASLYALSSRFLKRLFAGEGLADLIHIGRQLGPLDLISDKKGSMGCEIFSMIYWERVTAFCGLRRESEFMRYRSLSYFGFNR